MLLMMISVISCARRNSNCKLASVWSLTIWKLNKSFHFSGQRSFHVHVLCVFVDSIPILYGFIVVPRVYFFFRLMLFFITGLFDRIYASFIFRTYPSSFYCRWSLAKPDSRKSFSDSSSDSSSVFLGIFLTNSPVS